MRTLRAWARHCPDPPGRHGHGHRPLAEMLTGEENPRDDPVTFVRNG